MHVVFYAWKKTLLMVIFCLRHTLTLISLLTKTSLKHYPPKLQAWSNRFIEKWSDLVSKFDLKQCITCPTRVNKKSSTIIDHIYANNTAHIVKTFTSNSAIMITFLRIYCLQQTSIYVRVQNTLLLNIARLVTWQKELSVWIIMFWTRK